MHLSGPSEPAVKQAQAQQAAMPPPRRCRACLGSSTRVPAGSTAADCHHRCGAFWANPHPKRLGWPATPTKGCRMHPAVPGRMTTPSVLQAASARAAECAHAPGKAEICMAGSHCRHMCWNRAAASLRQSALQLPPHTRQQNGGSGGGHATAVRSLTWQLVRRVRLR